MTADPESDDAIVGMYVTIHIKDVPRHFYNDWYVLSIQLCHCQSCKSLWFSLKGYENWETVCQEQHSPFGRFWDATPWAKNVCPQFCREENSGFRWCNPVQRETNLPLRL